MNNLIFVAKNTGLKCLQYLLDVFPEDNNTIVVSNPDKIIIKDFLKSKGIRFIDLEEFDPKSIINNHYNWLLNLWSGYIFKKDILSIAENSLNIHPSFLPYGRGRDPVVWAIRNNTLAGVTLHKINEMVDEGEIWYQESIPYMFPSRGKDLYAEVVDKCVKIFQEHWPKIRTLEYKAIPQKITNENTKKRHHLLEDRIIHLDQNLPARDFLMKVLAHDFFPEYTSLLYYNDKKYKISITLEELVESNE